MSLAFAPNVITQLLAEAATADPRECCGILLGHDNQIERAFPAVNVHPTPLSHFEIDPQALVDCHRQARHGGMEVIGYYHSHPNGLAKPSATDRANASGDGKVWAIIAGNAVSLWRDAAGGFEPLSYRVNGA